VQGLVDGPVVEGGVPQEGPRPVARTPTRSWKFLSPTNSSPTAGFRLQFVNAITSEKMIGNSVKTRNPRKFGSRNPKTAGGGRLRWVMAGPAVGRSLRRAYQSPRLKSNG